MKNAKQTSKTDRFQEEFRELSLEEKIKILLKMEALTLQETIKYGINESIKVADRLGEVVADFGRKIEAEFGNTTNNDPEPATKTKRSPKAK